MKKLSSLSRSVSEKLVADGNSKTVPFLWCDIEQQAEFVGLLESKLESSIDKDVESIVFMKHKVFYHTI